MDNLEWEEVLYQEITHTKSINEILVNFYAFVSIFKF